MKKAIILLNHTLNEIQKEELANKFSVKEFVILPEKLQEVWSQVPPEIDSLEEWLHPFNTFLKENVQRDDVVVVQGEFGATYAMIQQIHNLDATALYATARRNTVEKKDGSKISLFEHVKFRRYI